ncbi:unannotated protein [freshwater metagenome]|uniref:Unannotated protein n=1 Tax=freshwater metagenome TaxID=449393 RepID=A0A6J6QPZ0_9ZZZZ
MAGMIICIDLDLCGKVVSRISFLPHGYWRQLGVAQVQLLVGVEDASGKVLGILAHGPDIFTALTHDNRGAGVLAHR